MRRVHITTPWFSAVVNVTDDYLINSIESCSAEPLIGWTASNLRVEFERAAMATGWGWRGVTFTDLPAERVVEDAA